MRSFEEAIKTQVNFLYELKGLEIRLIEEISQMISDYLRKYPKGKVGIISEGRSNLSLTASLQHFYNLLQNSECSFEFNNILKDTFNRYVYRNDLIIVASGSGKTRSVINFTKNIIENIKPKFLLGILGNKQSPLYELLSSEGYPIILIPKQENASDIYAPMGTEFEEKLLVLATSLFEDVANKLGIYNRDFKESLECYIRNFDELLKVKEEEVEENIDEVLMRRGQYVFDGKGISDKIAEQFMLRFLHLGKDAHMYHSNERKPFSKGDAIFCISGSGNTYEVVEHAIEAKSKKADVFVLTANEDSKLAKIADVVYIVPVREEFKELYKKYSLYSLQPPQVIRPPYFEINAHGYSNALIAKYADYLGLTARYMEKQHV